MSSSGPPSPPGQSGHWLLPSTIRPEDIEGLANFAEATTHPPTSGCWGRVGFDCPFQPTDETPDEWEERVFNCLWQSVNEDLSAGNRYFSSQRVLSSSGFGSAVTCTSQAYENGDLYGDDSAIAYAGESGDEETYGDHDVKTHAEAEGGDEALDSEYESEKPHASSGSKVWNEKAHQNSDKCDGNYSAYHSDYYEDPDSDEAEGQPIILAEEESKPEADDSDFDEDQIAEMANAMCRGDRRRTINELKKMRQVLKNQAGWSRDNSDTRESGAGPSIPPSNNRSNSDMRHSGTGPSVQPSKKAKGREKPALPSKKSSTHKFQGSSRGTSTSWTPSTTYQSMETPKKRKKSLGFGEDLDDDFYHPPSKEFKGRGIYALPLEQRLIRKLQSSSRHTLSPWTPSTAYDTMEGPNKGKETTEFEDDLDDDIYQPPSKKGRCIFGGHAQSPVEDFGGVNSGPSAQMPTKKSHRTPATAQNTVETIPGSTWPKSEGDELNRLLQARRDFERANNLTPLRDEKLFGLLSVQLQWVTHREKPRTKNACKNFWNRYGRGYYDCDERGDTKRSDSKVTSAQFSTKAKQQTQAKTKTSCKTKQKGQQVESEDDDDDDE